MPLLRRAKTFHSGSSKKDVDDKVKAREAIREKNKPNAEGLLTKSTSTSSFEEKQSVAKPKPILWTKKSQSTEILAGLKDNDLYKMQVAKHNIPGNGNDLKSVFLQHDMSQIMSDSRNRRLSRSLNEIFKKEYRKTPGDVREILKNLTNGKDKLESSQTVPPPKFPVLEDSEEVQCRLHDEGRHRRAKTTNFDLSSSSSISYKDPDFKIEGLIKATISDNDKKRTCLFSYDKGYFWCEYEKNKEKIKQNVDIKTGRLINKKDAELKDTLGHTYILTFDSPKSAKLFIENEKIQTSTNTDKWSITTRLLNLLVKRSSREMLEKKGIYKNEPIFGNTLENVYKSEGDVPVFILRTIELIERPGNITSTGLYRTSGNLATIQRIRLEVDYGKLSILDEFSKDVDVLTGSLKLFFRELKEQLITAEVCEELLKFTKSQITTQKEKNQIRKIVKKLPEANQKTLFVLLRHLLNVVGYKDENKMDIHNLSVCWGPSLIFLSDCNDLVSQSTSAARVIEFLLTFYSENPEELKNGTRQDSADPCPRPSIQRFASKDSLKSVDGSIKYQIKSTSCPNINHQVYDVIRKTTDLIELKLSEEGLYKRCGSSQKIDKIIKRMTKSKINELDKYKSDTRELAGALKRYVNDLPDPLIPKRSFEEFEHICDISGPKKLTEFKNIIDRIPTKEALLYLKNHILKVCERQKPYKDSIVEIWADILGNKETNEDLRHKFVKYLLEHFDDQNEIFKKTETVQFKMDQKDLEILKKERKSRYDNVRDSIYINGEMDGERIEYTKL